MRGDHLKRQMKKHEVKARSEDNVVTNGEGRTLGKVKGVNYEEIGKTISSEMKEFERKIEMERIVKTVVNKHSLNVNGLERAKKDALDISDNALILETVCLLKFLMPSGKSFCLFYGCSVPVTGPPPLSLTNTLNSG